MKKMFVFIVSFLPLLIVGSETALPDITNISSSLVSCINSIKKKNKTKMIPIVAIAGCSAVGKTEFTKELQQELKKINLKALILKQDDFMNPSAIISNYIIHPHLDHEKIYSIIETIKKGIFHIKKPKFDWKKKEVIYEEIDLTDTDIILFEGLYVLSGKESYDFLRYTDIGIFIEAQEKDIIEWNWQRENSGKCSHTPRERDKFDKDITWDMDDYRKNILPTKASADFIIKKDQNHNYSLIQK